MTPTGSVSPEETETTLDVIREVTVNGLERKIEAQQERVQMTGYRRGHWQASEGRVPGWVDKSDQKAQGKLRKTQQKRHTLLERK